MKTTQTLQLLNRQNGKSRLLFIDSTVEDYQSLMYGVLPDTEVVILDADSDGVEQISKILARRIGITSLHIVSHGAPGRVYLGNTELGEHNLNQYAEPLIYWAEALSADSQILLYGCDVAQTESGKTFVHRLSELTGAVVLASDDKTGSAALGGDWELEVKTGTSSVALAFPATTLESYRAILAQPYLVKDIVSGVADSFSVVTYLPSSPNYVSPPSQINNINGIVYFVISRGKKSSELWKSDGTEAGTVLIKDINLSGFSRIFGLNTFRLSPKTGRLRVVLKTRVANATQRIFAGITVKRIGRSAKSDRNSDTSRSH